MRFGGPCLGGAWCPLVGGVCACARGVRVVWYGVAQGLILLYTSQEMSGASGILPDGGASSDLIDAGGGGVYAKPVSRRGHRLVA